MKSLVFNEDCMQGMKQYPDKYFDLAVVDPPYGINININMGRKKGKAKKFTEHFYDNDMEIPNQYYFKELFRISKNQIIWGGNYMIENLYKSSCWLVWDKGFPEKLSFAQVELAWTSFKTSSKKFFYSSKKQNKTHPTQKPIELYEWIYLKYLPMGGKVIDTHLGSGTNRIAADKCKNIEFIGYELSKYYYDIQNKNWNNYKKQTKLF